VLAIKGSGWDLKSIEPRGFAPLRLEDLLALRERPDMADDEMVEYLALSLLDSAAPRPSIETLLHAFLPHDWVDHSHADALLALTNQPDSQAILRAVYGDEVGIVPYIQPGFELAKASLEVFERNPRVLGLVLDKHGLFTFGATAHESYERHIALVGRAEAHIAAVWPGTAAVPAAESPDDDVARLALGLRGALSRGRRVIVQFDGSERVRAFVDRPDLELISQVGPATPDHVMRTKRLPLVLCAFEPAEVTAAVEGYAASYQAYVRAQQTESGYQHDPYPRIVLAPGLGMFTAAASRAEAAIVADLYRHTMDIIEAATALGRYLVLSQAELFAMEYWPLELYKLTLAPSERELARRVAVVTGAGSGIGRAVARRLAAEGAYVFVTDLDEPAAIAVAEEIEASGAAADALVFDVSAESAAERVFGEIARRAGGVDVVVSNAGVASAAALDALDLDAWNRSLAVNATGHFLTCRAAVHQMRAQGLGGSIVLMCTKNVFDPGADFGAYSVAKAAELQLGRVLAIENGAHGIRVNMVNPDAVFGDSKLWSAELRHARAAAHGVAVAQLEAFYTGRNLLRVAISAADVAETVLFLASDRSAKTTGAVLPVDGGVRGAFPR
jgi:rhamnulose-1-phosphate aldolase/alcohol dehydrogenase